MKKSVRRSVFIAAVLMGLMLMGTSMTDVGAVYAKAKSPGKVTSMSLTVTGQPLAKLKWKQATGKANGYTIMRNGKKLVRVNGKDVLSYVDESLKPGKTYTYKVVPHYKNKKGKLTYGKASLNRVCRYFRLIVCSREFAAISVIFGATAFFLLFE